MRLGLASALAALAASALATPSSAAPIGATPAPEGVSAVVLAGERSGRDCRPYNGPYGFYGNPFCTGSFTESYPGRTIWGWDGGRSYWGWESADDNPPPRRAKRRTNE